MPLNALRSPLKSLNNNISVISPSKKRFIADEKPDLPPPSASSISQPLQLVALSPTKSSLIRSSQDEEIDTPPKSRLVIEKLVLTNFKSYVGVQEVGPFHSSFSAVVGPNGSGKSNVIDSMLFVFGFRASKMRQAKLSELIHNSAKHKNLQYCSVDIHFQQVIDKKEFKEDESPVEVIPEEGIIVTRKAFRNNTSEYYINGKKSNYTVVTTLLKEKGIDLDHKRFLILQGEVESIAQMKPKAERENDDGLLEYLEDIIGTADYKQKIENSLEQVSELNDVCAEKENRFELVEKEKNNLETDKDKALTFLKLERQLIIKKSAYYQCELQKRTEKSKDKLEKYNQLKEKLQKEKDTNLEINKSITELEKKHKEANSKIKNINEQIQELQKQQRMIDKENVRFDEQKKNLTNKIKKSEKLSNTAKVTLDSSNAKLQDNLKEQKEYEENLIQLQEQLEIENKELESIRLELSSKTKPYTDKIAKIQKELQPWNEKLNAKESQVKVAESNVKMIKEEYAGLDKEIESKQDLMEKIIEQGKEKQKQMITLKKEKARIHKQMEHGSKEIKHAEQKMITMRENLNNTRLKVMDAKNSLSTSQNKSKVLSGLLRLQKAGRISGFHGRLGDLGVIDDKYDVAVSTASSQLDDMVVDTVEIGQQCIDYLRSKNLGYARFICLNKLRLFNMNKINTPMNIPRLFDLITPKHEKFLPAFYSALRDTLAADNLKLANQAAYGSQRRYRVVTLDGKLIDTSGTLSGGGNYVHKGGMKTKSNSSSMNDELYTEEDVQQLEAELAAKEKHFLVAQDTLHEMEEALKELKDRDPEVDMQISKIELEVKSLTSDLTSLTKVVEELTANKATAEAKLQKDLKEAEKVVNVHRQELQELKDGASSLENELKELEEKIMDIGGVKLKMQKSKIDGIIQKVEILNQKTSSVVHTIKKLQNEIKRSEKSLANNEKELQNGKVELVNLEEKFSKKNGSTLDLERKINEFENEKEKINSESEEIKDELDAKQTQINELKSTEIELENQIEKYEGAVKHEQKAIASLKQHLNSLHLRDVSHLIGWLELDIPVKKAPRTKEQVNKKKRKRRTKILEETGEEVENENENEDEDEDEDEEMDVDEEPENSKSEDISRNSEEHDDNDQNNKSMNEENTNGDQAKDQNAKEAEEQEQQEEEYDSRELEELRELFKASELAELTAKQIQSTDIEELQAEIEKLEDELEDIKVDVDVLEEYGKRASEYQHRKVDLNEAVAKREELRNYVEDLKKKRLNEFMKGFFTISMTLKEMYQMITMGGNAELELVDSLDPFSEGILFSVMPPKKSWRNISNLSGGEKTLSSLALVFALHRYKPTPLYVMDEIDAALDFRNVSIVANYIKERTKNAQFIVISLRNNMFELSQRLVGIYKVDNMTRSVTLKNKDLVNKSSLNNSDSATSNNNSQNSSNGASSNGRSSTPTLNRGSIIGSQKKSLSPIPQEDELDVSDKLNVSVKLDDYDKATAKDDESTSKENEER